MDGRMDMGPKKQQQEIEVYRIFLKAFVCVCGGGVVWRSETTFGDYPGPPHRFGIELRLSDLAARTLNC